jgi:hypothetical protein
MEYLFKKDAMLKLLAESPDDDTLVVSINFKHGDAKGVFIGEIMAYTTMADSANGYQAKRGGPVPVFGCPNPPGCN